MTEENEEFKGKSSFMPIIISAGIAILLLGLVVYIPLFVTGLIIVALALLKVFKDGSEEKFSKKKEFPGETYPLEHAGGEKIGVWIFLTSEILVFGSLIAAYVYVRVGSNSWPIAAQTHDVILGMVNTIILLTSSLSMVLALYFIKTGNTKGLKIGLASAFALGAAFLAIKLGIEWPQLIRNGFTINSGLPGSSYYMLTGVHAVHLAAGMIAVAYLMIRAFSGGFTVSKHSGVENVGLYWHFVDVVWMFLFPLFYLI